jgi:hypothetical protein
MGGGAGLQQVAGSHASECVLCRAAGADRGGLAVAGLEATQVIVDTQGKGKQLVSQGTSRV